MSVRRWEWGAMPSTQGYSSVLSVMLMLQRLSTHVVYRGYNTWIPLSQICHMFTPTALQNTISSGKSATLSTPHMFYDLIKSNSSVKPAEWGRMRPSKTFLSSHGLNNFLLSAFKIPGHLFLYALNKYWVTLIC